MQKVVIVPFTAEGEMVAGDFRDGVIGDASTMDDATELAKSKGFTIVDFDTPNSIPSELIGEDQDAFAIGVYA